MPSGGRRKGRGAPAWPVSCPMLSGRPGRKEKLKSELLEVGEGRPPPRPARTAARAARAPGSSQCVGLRGTEQGGRRPPALDLDRALDMPPEHSFHLGSLTSALSPAPAPMRPRSVRVKLCFRKAGTLESPGARAPAPAYATLARLPWVPRRPVPKICNVGTRERRGVQPGPSPRPPPSRVSCSTPSPAPNSPASESQGPCAPGSRPPGDALTFPHDGLQPRGRHLPLGAPPLPRLSPGGGVAPRVTHVDRTPRSLAPPPRAPGPAARVSTQTGTQSPPTIRPQT